MRGHAIWNIAMQAWWTSGNAFVKGGIPKVWGDRNNAAKCINQGKVADECRFGRSNRKDIRLIRVDITPLDKAHMT